jgi:hypothetical protein
LREATSDSQFLYVFCKNLVHIHACIKHE